MASDNKLELVVEVQAEKANAQIKGVNHSLASIERIAVSVSKNASEGIDGMTASMVKGSLAGNLLAEAIKECPMSLRATDGDESRAWERASRAPHVAPASRR